MNLMDKLEILKKECDVSYKFISGKVEKAKKLGYIIRLMDPQEQEEGLIGFFDHNTGELLIDPNLDSMDFAETLLHEYYHMIQLESESSYWREWAALPDVEDEGVDLLTFRKIMHATKVLEWDCEARCIADVLEGKLKTDLTSLYTAANLNVLQHDVQAVCGRGALYPYQDSEYLREIVPNDTLVYNLSELPNKVEVFSVMKEAMFHNVRRDWT